jgi:hypothetical protein
MYTLNQYERETIISFNDGEDNASFYTCNKAWQRKLDKLCSQNKGVTLEREDEHSKWYTIPKKWIKVRIPRQLSEKQRKELAQRARANFGKNK